MISRRGLAGLAGTAAVTLGAVFARQGQAQTTALADLADLETSPATNSPIHIPGQGWFESKTANGLADGVVQIEGPDGQYWTRMDFSGALKPAWFSQASDRDDDALAIQRALDHAARFGPFAIDLENKRHRCLTPLTIDPTRMALRGAGAVLDFSAIPEPVRHDPIFQLDDIALTQGWERTNGVLSTSNDAQARPLIHDLQLPEEGRYRLSLTVDAVTGDADFPNVKVSLSDRSTATPASITAIASGDHDLELWGPVPNAQLTIETNADIRISALQIAFHGQRECVLIASNEDSPQYGHKWMEGIEIVGPGLGTLRHGIRFETGAEARSSRLILRDVTVRNFHTGLMFSHRAYLINATGLRCACEKAGLHFLGGLRDAGELISLYASVIDGGEIAILNNDAEVALFGTAIDFVDQVFVGSGRLLLHGCHLEVNRPKASDKPLIDLGQGDVTLNGGSFTVTGADFDAGNQCQHIFLLRSRAATASMRDVTTYNLRSQSGALAGGLGRLDTALIRGRRPRHMAPIVQFDPQRNLLGTVPLDLRTSNGAAGTFNRFPTDVTTFKASPAYRHIWLFGVARPGAELGVFFRLRSETPGTILASVQAVKGDTRQVIGDIWPVPATTDWTRYLNNTANTHPASPGDGRMPEGFDEVALMLDLTEIEGTVEFADFFLSPV
ncbi:hypothetical protein [Yoonia sp. BS5-3]|uniref:Uncharacterized protein n=1 Tax=Yoonia phaeophyticola TaxID=3137369 RepID=A0ABZ2V9G7_9RHOB